MKLEEDEIGEFSLEEEPSEETEFAWLELDSKNEEMIELDALALEDFWMGSVALDVWPMEDSPLDESLAWSLFEGLFEQAIRIRNGSNEIFFIL